MTNLQYLGLFTLVSPVLLWAFFFLLFNTLAGKMPWWSYPLWIVGAAVDIYVNVWASFLFLQAPDINRMFLSARLDNLIKNGTGWRRSLALWIVGVFLEPYDKTGQHSTYGAFK
jgi:hypothetical protein